MMTERQGQPVRIEDERLSQHPPLPRLEHERLSLPALLQLDEVSRQNFAKCAISEPAAYERQASARRAIRNRAS